MPDEEYSLFLEKYHLIPEKSNSDNIDYDKILWNILKKHRGHKVSIVSYGNYDNPENISLKCEDCGEVILDAGIYTICARENKNIEKEKIQFIHDSLGEAKDFSKEVNRRTV